MLAEETIEAYLAAKEDFRREITPKTRKAIRELITETHISFRDNARINFLKDRMTERIYSLFRLLARYEINFGRNRIAERIMVGEDIHSLLKDLLNNQHEVITLQHPISPKNSFKNEITKDMVRRAREFPLNTLLEFHQGKAHCPLHEDRTPSLHYYPEHNTAYCFSCHEIFNPIDWLISADGCSFKEAVLRLLRGQEISGPHASICAREEAYDHLRL